MTYFFTKSHKQLLLLLFTLAAFTLCGPLSSAQAEEPAKQSENLYQQFYQQIEKKEGAERSQIINRMFDTKGEASEAYRGLLGTVYDCAIVTNRVLRLRCYDQIAVDNGIHTTDWKKREDKRLGEFGFWEASQYTNDIGEKVLYLRLIPNNALTGRENLPLKPELVLKCTLNDLDAYIDWKRTLTNARNEKLFYIEYNIDKREDFYDEWNLSLDKKAAFAPDPVKFLEALQNGHNLYVAFTTQDDGVQHLLFNLEGLDKAMGMIVEHCYK